MSAKKENNTETDWKQLAQSINGRSGAHYEDLKAIWVLAERMIRFVDENYPKPIYTAIEWYKSLFKEPSSIGVISNDKKIKLKDIAYHINAHSVLHHKFDLIMDYRDSLIAESYFGAVGMLARIENATNFYARYSHEIRKSRVNTMQFIEDLCGDGQVPDSFMNAVVPHFFSLRTHCLHLIEIATWNKKGSPADPRVRANRAAAGGKVKNHGEHVLKDMVLNFLNEQPSEPIHRSISTLCAALHAGLNKTREDYLALLESPTERGGLPLRYGEDQKDLFDFRRKFLEWKKDPEFRKALDRICVIRRYGPVVRQEESGGSINNPPVDS